MWVRFTQDFAWSPPEKRGRVIIEYRTGMTLFVRRKCAEKAIAAGVAEAVTKGENYNAPQ